MINEHVVCSVKCELCRMDIGTEEAFLLVQKKVPLLILLRVVSIAIFFISSTIVRDLHYIAIRLKL